MAEPMTADVARSLIESLWNPHKDLLQPCESPIEKLMVAAMIRAGLAPRIAVQQQIGNHRADIVVDGWLVVECDGFEWHYHREDQVAADLRRTRALLVQGYTVVRFTGREIWGDVDRCVGEIVAVLETRGAA